MHVIRWSRISDASCERPRRRGGCGLSPILGLASNTVEAYGRGVEQYLMF